MNIEGVRPLTLYFEVLECLSNTLPYLFLVVGPNSFNTIQNYLEQKDQILLRSGQERTSHQDFIQLSSVLRLHDTHYVSETDTLKFCSRL